MHDSPFLVVNILTMILGYQGLVIKTPIYIQYADIKKNSPFFGKQFSKKKYKIYLLHIYTYVSQV